MCSGNVSKLATISSRIEAASRSVLGRTSETGYFESREAVLLDLLVLRADDFFTEVGGQLRDVVDDDESARGRAATVASALATAFAARPMLCELICAQAGVLEHNVSAELVARYKRGGYESLAGFTAALRVVLPELSEEEVNEAARTVIVLAGALWTHAHPPQAVQDAYAADPSLVFLPDGFVASLERAINIQLLGLLAA